MVLIITVKMVLFAAIFGFDKGSVLIPFYNIQHLLQLLNIEYIKLLILNIGYTKLLIPNVIYIILNVGYTNNYIPNIEYINHNISNIR